MRLEGRDAVVVGGTNGIGLGIAAAMLREGARVAIIGRDKDRGSEAVERLDGGDRAHFVSGDATDRVSIDRALDLCIEQLGGLDVLVNSVGAIPTPATLARTTDESWMAALNGNVTCAFFASRRALTHLLAQRSGRIINVSSIQGKQAAPGHAGYSAGKAALNALTISLAREVGTKGITVNALCPGLVLTEATQRQFDRIEKKTGSTSDEVIDAFTAPGALKRVTTVEDVAELAVFIASDAAAGITGALLSVDGGLANY